MKKKIIVVKIGSLGVTEEQGGVSIPKLSQLTHDLVELYQAGYALVLVSSGAINTARPLLPILKEMPASISKQQALSSLGQPLLMKHYDQLFTKHGIIPAQILVTHEDFKQRERHLNIRNTIHTLLEAGALPIINENDAVSFKEITVGDNDQLATMVAQAIEADRLVLLTEADGLYDRHPQDPLAKKFEQVEYGQDLRHVKMSQKTSVGRGGMKTKLEAIKKLTPLGVDVILAGFNFPNPVSRALNGLGGTCFKGSPLAKIKGKKAWLATVARPNASIMIDEGAHKALLKGASLLPVGIKKISGSFKRGDVVSIKFHREVLGHGCVEYHSTELDKIKGKKSSELSAILEHVTSHEAIHRDHLFLKSEKA